MLSTPPPKKKIVFKKFPTSQKNKNTAHPHLTACSGHSANTNLFFPSLQNSKQYISVDKIALLLT
jgi:hypothetical protein